MIRNRFILALTLGILGMSSLAFAQQQTAMVIVVENNESAGAPRGTLDEGRAASKEAEFLDAIGEEAMASELRKIAAAHYDEVVVLMDDRASFKSFRHQLHRLHDQGFVIDVVLNIHGAGLTTGLNNSECRGDFLYFTGKPNATPEMIADLKREGESLNLNAVYMVSCWGSRFNEAWLEAGARGVNGANQLNYYVLFSPPAFLKAFLNEGLDLEAASQKAYDNEHSMFKLGFQMLGKRLDQELRRRYAQDPSKPIFVDRSSERVQAGEKVHWAGWRPSTGKAAEGTAR